ncbi:antiviral reverse transcriptase Drt3b [Arcobacter sp. YIC-464]|uniref:antiviral reverse transcriptase Drt3b n=1 Tax=Arcobacter sp. YIC-464 TaxID=3376631 RepID=UPI003C2077BC
MQNKKRIKIKYNKNRVVLSDILPYELPIIFTNRYFYRFLTKFRISFNIKDNGKYEIKCKELSKHQKEILRLIFNGIEVNKDSADCTNNLITIPFNFKISHKENDFRELSIIHPINQLVFIWFYNEYSESIKYYCNISEFSLRRPYKTAKYKIYNNEKIDNIFDKYESIEEHGKNYENLKTFFSYKNYSNIHKFFESYKYQRAEKKFNEMYKFDITKCFDSIYTHSISWMVYNKQIVKEMISKKLTNSNFSSLFDELMQRANYNETNGILIGPEFSRIFAEILLQKIDNEVLMTLKKEKLYSKKDYEIFRYVDDFFIFYNDKSVKDLVFQTYQLELKKFRLYINENKCKTYEKPIITELTMAKEKINELLNTNLSFEKVLNEETNEVKDLNFYINSQKLITKFKIIVKETNITYNEILNWTFAIINNILETVFSNFKDINNHTKSEYKLCKFILEVLDFSFFLYAINPKTNSTIKISSILSLIIKFTKENNSISEVKHLIFKKVFDEVIFILNKHALNKYTQIETSYLLIVLSELGKMYRIDKCDLFKYFKLYDKNNTLNYLSIVILLFYIKDIRRYKIIKRHLKSHILKNFELNKGSLNKGTETVFLLFDILSCPYINEKFKNLILKKYGVAENLHKKIINEEKNWFIKWDNLDFMLELKNKKSLEVYP